MSVELPNTIEVVDDDLADILRRMSPSQRFAMAAEANDTTRALVAAGLRFTHPEWTDNRIQHEVARRMLDAAD